MSAPEETLAFQLRAMKIPFEREHRFHKKRRWRFDFAWPDRKLALEVEGGIWVQGAHTRGRHFESDATKYNEAALDGWTVLRCSPGQIDSGECLVWVERAMGVAA